MTKDFTERKNWKEKNHYMIFMGYTDTTSISYLTNTYIRFTVY